MRIARPITHTVVRPLTDPLVGSASFTPGQLFTSGEQGLWLDPSDFTRYMADRGPELVSNGTFNTDVAGWSANASTLAVVGGELEVTATATTEIGASTPLATVAGRYYEVSLTMRAAATNSVANACRVRVSSSATGGDIASTSAVTSNGTITTVKVSFVATLATHYIQLNVASAVAWGGVGDKAYFDNISVRELTAINTATMFQDAAGTTPVTAVEQPVGKILDKSGRGNHTSQTTDAARSVLKKSGAYYYRQSDGVDDSAATMTGGGASTAALIIMGFRTDAIGAAQTLFSDRSGNTGLKLEITAGGNIAFSGGNGASINTATGAAAAANTDYVVTAYYDGTNLSVQLNNGTATTAACSLSSGTAAITFGKDNGAASGFHNGREYQTIYLKNVTKSAGEISIAKSYVAAKCGVTL